MLFNCWSSASSPPCRGGGAPAAASGRLLFQSRSKRSPFSGLSDASAHPPQLICSTLLPRRRPKSILMLSLKDGVYAIADISHNKVLIAAAVSAAVGQLTKPLSAAILYRESFDFKAVFQAGGFPSTHSSAVVATATCIGLERGFSDSIFGLAIVYASLTMYDAQGVRREVGSHARALNRMFHRPSTTMKTSSNRNVGTDSSSENSTSKLESLNLQLKEPNKNRSKPNTSSLLLRSGNGINQSTSILVSSGLDADVEGGLRNGAQYSDLFKESVGHTEIEVIAGAFLGFCISLAVCSV